jgi:hypothetical protein
LKKKRRCEVAAPTIGIRAAKIRGGGATDSMRDGGQQRKEDGGGVKPLDGHGVVISLSMSSGDHGVLLR